MRNVLRAVGLPTAFVMLSSVVMAANAADDNRRHHGQKDGDSIQLGPRPFYLIEGMDEGPLKHRLMQCQEDGPFRRTDFSIGHRGAALQFPEHTQESCESAARQGAGIVECDVTSRTTRNSYAAMRRMTSTPRPAFW